MALTEQQRQELDRRRRGANKPRFFSATEGKPIQIGEDLEGFVILVPGGLREEIVERLNVSNEGDQRREELYEEALSFELTDAETVLQDHDAKIRSFANFRQDIFDSPFGTSPQVAAMIADVQRVISDAIELRDRSYHTFQITKVLAQLHTRREGTQDQIKQRNSWEPILSAYRTDLESSLPAFSVPGQIAGPLQAPSNILEPQDEELSPEEATTRAKKIAEAYPNSGLALAQAIVEVADRIGAKWYDLANVIAWETDSTFSSTIQNPRSNAVGLIQFIPKTASTLGTSTAKLKQMTPVEQMKFVERYFVLYKNGQGDDKTPGPLNTFQSLAMAVFFPWARYVDPRTPFAVLDTSPIPGLGSKVSQQNPGTYKPLDYLERVKAHSRLDPDDPSLNALS